MLLCHSQVINDNTGQWGALGGERFHSGKKCPLIRASFNTVQIIAGVQLRSLYTIALTHWGRVTHIHVYASVN